MARAVGVGTAVTCPFHLAVSGDALLLTAELLKVFVVGEPRALGSWSACTSFPSGGIRTSALPTLPPAPSRLSPWNTPGDRGCASAH